MTNIAEKVINDFKDFALNTQSMDIAVGFLLGAAVNPLARSIIDDLTIPITSYLFGKNKSLEDGFFVLKSGDSKKENYSNSNEAKKDNAIIIDYGKLLSAGLNFITVAGTAYLITKTAHKLRNQKIDIPNPLESLSGISPMSLGQYESMPQLMNDSTQKEFKPVLSENRAPFYDGLNQYYAHKGDTGSFAVKNMPGFEDFTYDSRYWRTGPATYVKRKPVQVVHFPTTSKFATWNKSYPKNSAYLPY